MIEVDDIFSQKNFDVFFEIVNLIDDISQEERDKLIKEYRAGNHILEEFAARWSSTVDTKPDFSVYDSLFYINEAFVCWKLYSKRYLKLINKYLHTEHSSVKMDEVSQILDLGCGVGLTTIGLKNIFPQAKVFGTQFESSYQYEVADKLLKCNKDLVLLSDKETLNIDSIDLVFASEFFEHLQEPIELLQDLIDTYHPTYFIIANTFSKMAIGHFNKYYYNGFTYNGKQISRKFNSILKNSGYEKIETGFFNNRPVIWKRINKLNKVDMFN